MKNLNTDFKRKSLKIYLELLSKKWTAFGQTLEMYSGSESSDEEFFKIFTTLRHWGAPTTELILSFVDDMIDELSDDFDKKILLMPNKLILVSSLFFVPAALILIFSTIFMKFGVEIL